MDPSNERDGESVLRVGIRGGDPSPVEVAAVVAAVTGMLASRTPVAAVAGSAWARAARLEGTGQSVLHSADDRRLHRRPSGTPIS